MPERMIERPARLALASMIAAASVALIAGCSASPLSDTQRDVLQARADGAMDEFTERPNVRRFLDDAYGYAIFPRVTKGAFGVGGARGQGLVYEQGRLIGNAVLTQASIGFQLGGQTFQEIILFEDEQALANFTRGNLEFDAGASAVAGTAGGGATINYENGVAVFVRTNAGLMYEASIGGQNFSFNPIDG